MFSKCELSKNSWLVVGRLSEENATKALENFDAMYALRPKESRVLVGTEKVETVSNRGHASYGCTPMDPTKPRKSYMFSGWDVSRNTDPLPEVFAPAKLEGFNQYVVNWYDGGDDIPMHSDCVEGMVPGASIAIVSLGAPRTLHFVSRDSPRHGIALRVDHGSVVYMCGDTQKEFRHGVQAGEGKRISVTQRIYPEACTSRM